jgi:hypothetical protein
LGSVEYPRRDLFRTNPFFSFPVFSRNEGGKYEKGEDTFLRILIAVWLIEMDSFEVYLAIAGSSEDHRLGPK